MIYLDSKPKTGQPTASRFDSKANHDLLPVDYAGLTEGPIVHTLDLKLYTNYIPSNTKRSTNWIFEECLQYPNNTPSKLGATNNAVISGQRKIQSH